jgi:hypothetical protein
MNGMSARPPTFISDEGKVPISMIVTPGPALAKKSEMRYVVESSPYSENQQCYIDCALSIPGYDPNNVFANAKYGWTWAASALNVVYKNCFTGRILATNQQRQCGDCTSENDKKAQCAGIPSQTLTPVRNTPVSITISPKDLFGSNAQTASGSKYVVTLQGTGLINETVVHGDTPIATKGGEYSVSIVPPLVGNYTLTINYQIIDPNNPLRTVQSAIYGSPYDLQALEPSCPPNSEVEDAKGGCQCSPGYGKSKTTHLCIPCTKGKFKDAVGDVGCSACGAGKVSLSIGGIACTYCPGGKDTRVADVCTDCVAGEFRADQAVVVDPITKTSAPGTMCTPCANGFVSVAGEESCKICDGGYFASSKTTCTRCPVGRARKTQKNCNDPKTCTATTCEDCAVGLAAPLLGQSNCTVCGKGKFADALATVTCKSCLAGRFSATERSETCDVCPGGYFSADAEASSCSGCSAGQFSPSDGGAIKCTSCKKTPDTLYAPEKSTECIGCVSPLQIRLGSLAASVNDCACPENFYLSSGTVAISPVCSNCPDGGYCPQGTPNITDVAAKPGYWRPSQTTATFWKCPVSTITGDGFKWRNWMTCYGGKNSQCAPVFDWRNMKIKSGNVNQPILLAMEDASIPVSITKPGDFGTYLNTSSNFEKYTGVTLSHAIAAYVAYIHNNGDRSFIQSNGLSNTSKLSTNGATMDFLEFFTEAEGLWINSKFVPKKNINQFANKAIVAGWMSGPLCAICPAGTGRNGDFKSDSVCEPCPTDSGVNSAIVFGLFLGAFAMVILFVYGQIKKGAHELHLEQEHIREHNSSRPTDEGEETEKILDQVSSTLNSNPMSSEYNEETDTQIERSEDNESEDNESEDNKSEDNKSEDNKSEDNESEDNESEDNESEDNDTTTEPAISKVRRGRRRASTTVYKHEKTKFSKDETYKSLEEHLELQKAHGTLSGNIMSHKQVLTGMSRIMMSYLQVVAIARAVPISWPREVITTLDFFAVVSAPSLSLASVDCALNGGKAESPVKSQAQMIASSIDVVGMKLIFQKFIMTMLIPLAAWSLPLIFWGLYYIIGKRCCFKKFGCKKCYPWIHKMPSKETNFRNFKNLDEVNYAELWDRTKERYKITVMVISFLFYPTVCRGVIQMWSCQAFGDVQYLISDMSVS